jgi:hypothetical protein
LLERSLLLLRRLRLRSLIRGRLFRGGLLLRSLRLSGRG